MAMDPQHFDHVMTWPGFACNSDAPTTGQQRNCSLIISMHFNVCIMYASTLAITVSRGLLICGFTHSIVSADLIRTEKCVWILACKKLCKPLKFTCTGLLHEKREKLHERNVGPRTLGKFNRPLQQLTINDKECQHNATSPLRISIITRKEKVSLDVFRNVWKSSCMSMAWRVAFTDTQVIR